MPKLEAVLFGMDGLLVDTEPLWLETENEIMVRLGAAPSAEDQEQLLGRPMDCTVAYLMEKAASPAAKGKVARWLADGMLARIAAGRASVQPGARELVSEVIAAGIPCALVTGSQREFTEAVLGATGLEFPVTVTADDVAVTKPGPEPYLAAARYLGVVPERCVALEDSPTGTASAAAAGCRVVAVSSVAPIPAGDGCTVVASLSELTVENLWSLVTAPRPARQQAP